MEINYPTDFINKIIQGDCLEIMKTMPDKSVDLTLTDFPYGIGEDYDVFNDSEENVKKLINETMPEILRVSKRVLLTCGTRRITWYPPSDWILAWVVPAGAGRNPWGFTCWQPILAYGKDPYLENRMGSRPDIIQHTETSEKNGHPCPKPINVWKKILLRGSVKETDLIFDPFAGSGTTLVAAKQLKRNYIGVEISEKYCEIAKQRLRQEVLL